MFGDEVEQIPLGHEGDELGVGGKAGEIDYRESLVAEGDRQFADLAVTKGEEFVEEAQLVEEFERRGVDGVAAEVAEEVLVLFEDGDVDALAGEEEAEHHAGGTSANDAARGLGGSRHGMTFNLIAAWGQIIG